MTVDGAQCSGDVRIAQDAGALEMGDEPFAKRPLSVHCVSFCPGSEGSCGGRANEGNPL
jgi:hypothetical protein